MVIVIGVTITKNEDQTIFLENVKLLKRNELFSEVIVIINSNNENVNTTINKVGDLVESRKDLSIEMAKHNADAYMLLDSDISLKNTNVNKAMNYKNEYDVISMYYTGDSPLPALLTISSSLNDVLYGSPKLNDVPFDDGELDSSNYLMVGNPNGMQVNELLLGKNTRKIVPSIDGVNKKDFTSGGSSIYFDKIALRQHFDWEHYNGKSLKWYDTYKMIKLSKNFKYAKVPVFVKHIRGEDTEVKLSWDEFERYFLGLERIYPERAKAFQLKKVLLKLRIEYLLKISNIRSAKWK